MFEFLQQIDVKLYDRYLTLEKNIKAASNSFYDSYLDLQEDFIKTVCAHNGVECAPHETCGALLRRDEVKNLFMLTLGLDSYAYGKMGDYAKKTNEHKHGKEKNIVVDTIVGYMRVFYDVSSCYARAAGIAVPQFDGKYFINLFGSMAKVDERLSGIDERLGGIEEVQREIIRELQEKKSAPPQSAAAGSARQNDGRLLKNFIINAYKEYDWLGTSGQFKTSRTALLCVQLALIFTGLISTVISSVCFKLYSTFTLFENIVVFGTLWLAKYTAKSKKRYNDFDLANNTADIFARDGDGIWRDSNREKKRYKYFRRISYFAVIGNIVCFWTMSGGAIAAAATIFEVIFLGLTVAANFLRINHFCMYCNIYITGYNADKTKRVTLVYSKADDKLYTLQDYTSKFAFLQ